MSVQTMSDRRYRAPTASEIRMEAKQQLSGNEVSMMGRPVKLHLRSFSNSNSSSSERSPEHDDALTPSRRLHLVQLQPLPDAIPAAADPNTLSVGSGSPMGFHTKLVDSKGRCISATPTAAVVKRNMLPLRRFHTAPSARLQLDQDECSPSSLGSVVDECSPCSSASLMSPTNMVPHTPKSTNTNGHTHTPQRSTFHRRASSASKHSSRIIFRNTELRTATPPPPPVPIHVPTQQQQETFQAVVPATAITVNPVTPVIPAVAIRIPGRLSDLSDSRSADNSPKVTVERRKHPYRHKREEWRIDDSRFESAQTASHFKTGSSGGSGASQDSGPLAVTVSTAATTVGGTAEPFRNFDQIEEPVSPLQRIKLTRHHHHHHKNIPEARPVEDIFGGEKLIWKKGDLIGEGAYGRVYRGLNQKTGQFMAVKQLKIDGNLATYSKQLAALQREISTFNGLDHPHIVRYIGAQKDEDDDSICIFMENMPGGSIAQLLVRFGPFSETVIRKYTKQILLGLQYLHSKGIVHRDVKGANMLVDADGTVKVADFGASKQIEELLSMSDGFKSIKGSVYWMAPEVMTQAGHGRRADIWSVGCTVIEMATAAHPWPDYPTYVTALFQIANAAGPPPFPDFLSNDAKDFICLCCNRDPKSRPRAAELLNHPFITNSDEPT
eukprot:GILK01007982.1.p1 GENE.GILK01007982.1~~GILK01007982.1.p1  ORF type:complete len:666 (+),score=101.11 GILK01007982.1:82-2079(+)